MREDTRLVPYGNYRRPYSGYSGGCGYHPRAKKRNRRQRRNDSAIRTHLFSLGLLGEKEVMAMSDGELFDSYCHVTKEACGGAFDSLCSLAGSLFCFVAAVSVFVFKVISALLDCVSGNRD